MSLRKTLSWLLTKLNNNSKIFTISNCYILFEYTVKPVYNGHSKIDKIKILMVNGSLMKVESTAEFSPWSILQYFWPALSYNWKSICGLFESGRFTQVLLYSDYVMNCYKYHKEIFK